MRSPTRRAATAAFAMALAATSCAGSSADSVLTSAAEPAVAATSQVVAEAPPTSPPVQAAPADDAAPADTDEAPAEAESAAPEPEPATPEPAPVAPAVAALQLPDVQVVDLSNGETTALGDFARPGPTLVWFWAPHWPSCVAEGPAVAQLAQDNPDLNVLGLGAQDSLDFANSFVDNVGLADSDIALVWDPSFASWREFGIRSQPYWILFDAAGNEVTSQPGVIDLAAVQAVLDAA